MPSAPAKSPSRNVVATASRSSCDDGWLILCTRDGKGRAGESARPVVSGRALAKRLVVADLREQRSDLGRVALDGFVLCAIENVHDTESDPRIGDAAGVLVGLEFERCHDARIRDALR